MEQAVPSFSQQIPMELRLFSWKNVPNMFSKSSIPRHDSLVGGFNPSEKHWSKWDVFPQIGVKIKTYLSCHHLVLHGCFQKQWYPHIIHFNKVFHYKPSILGYFYFWKHPHSHSQNSSVGAKKPHLLTDPLLVIIVDIRAIWKGNHPILRGLTNNG